MEQELSNYGKCYLYLERKLKIKSVFSEKGK